MYMFPKTAVISQQQQDIRLCDGDELVLCQVGTWILNGNYTRTSVFQRVVPQSHRDRKVCNVISIVTLVDGCLSVAKVRMTRAPSSRGFVCVCYCFSLC